MPCVGRGGGLLAMDGGTYEIDDLVLEHSIHAKNGVGTSGMSGTKYCKRICRAVWCKSICCQSAGCR